MSLDSKISDNSFLLFAQCKTKLNFYAHDFDDISEAETDWSLEIPSDLEILNSEHSRFFPGRVYVTDNSNQTRSFDLETSVYQKISSNSWRVIPRDLHPQQFYDIQKSRTRCKLIDDRIFCNSRNGIYLLGNLDLKK